MRDEHLVHPGKLGITCTSGIFWTDEFDGVWRTQNGSYEKAEYVLVVSSPVLLKITQYLDRWCYKVLIGEKLRWIKVTDILDPYFDGARTCLNPIPIPNF
jgi:hypothetical protein